jgi:hypothetical protein
MVAVCCPSPEPGPHWRIEICSLSLEEDGMRVQLGFSGAASLPQLSAIAMAMAGDPPYVCGAAHERRTSREKPSQNTLPEDDCTRTYTAEKKQKIRP